MKNGSRIVLLIISVFLLLSSFVFIPHLCSLFMFLTGAFLLPIGKWQDIIKKALPKKWLRVTLSLVLLLTAFVTIPSNGIGGSAAAPQVTPTPIATISPETGTDESAGAASESDQSSTPTPSDPVGGELPAGSSFTVHFIDVGQADAALVLCDGHAMLIDGGNVADSNLIYSYLKKQNVDHLDYIVCTHAHEDHVGGLAGALNYATVGVAYCPVTSYDSDAFNDFVKYLDKQGVSITVPKAGDTFALGSAGVMVLGPISASDEPNNTSIVLRIVYGDTSLLFTGDAEREEEQDILNAGYTLSSNVLKVGHHGSSTSTSYPFLREVMPQYAVISVGKDNSYGHPDEDTLSRLRDADVKVYRTDMQGDIICASDGKTMTFSVARNADADTLAEAGKNSLKAMETPTAVPIENTAATSTPAGTEYIVNTSTGKFHLPSCSSVDQMNESNKWYYTGSRDELKAQGYEPCQRCNP